jgi:hypothetical protein
MIHSSKINIITEKKDASGRPLPFDFEAITLEGERIQGKNCVVTSSNYENKTRNILFIDSQEIRKLRNISFIEINGVEVTL